MLKRIVWTGCRWWLSELPAALLVIPLILMVAHAHAEHERQAACLALNDYHEARSESVTGRIAVTNVVLNRVRDSRYPDTVCGVVWQSRQFSWWDDERSNMPTLNTPAERQAWEEAQALARHQLDSTERYLVVSCAEEALWYHADYARPSWSRELQETCSLGRHLFYAEELPPPKPRRKPAPPEPGFPGIEKEEIMLAHVVS